MKANTLFRARPYSTLAILIATCLALAVSSTEAAQSSMELFNGKDLSGWRAPAGDWLAAKNVSLDPADAAKFAIEPGEGVLVNGAKGRTIDIFTEPEFGDVEAHVEFCVPKHSNSGVYFMGRYEVQVFDSFGVANDKYPGIECGGIYPRWTQERGEFEGHSPRVNASKPPGEWQSFDVIFQAPRFDAAGKKIANAKFIKVAHNGQVVHENIEVTGPTRAAHWENEQATGPLMFQGDHGPVAYRNVRVKPISPVPFGPVPTARQLRWHDMEFYGFLHFTVNTFTDKEWGYGDEAESVFNPTAFDADQIARTAVEAGMKGLILTAKHHDGFCLWPSKYTEHSVKNSPWKNGQGDVVKEVSEACRRHGLRFGVYLSPWDRNHKDYARPEYIVYYRNQLRELLNNYGDIFTVWFDGANGGDGFYGGAREMRRIDNRTYYDWKNTWQIVRERMPMAAMFSDVGPDFRWVGNEGGIAGETCWATLNPADGVPGNTKANLNQGERPGTHWIPAECDVSIRPGWFYHASEDSRVKTPAELLRIYYCSVGRGACLNLNLPPDRRGQIHANDIQSLREFRRILDATFAKDFAQGATITASNIRHESVPFAPQNVIDGNRHTYWSTDDGNTAPELVFDLGQPATFNVISLREYLPLGQRVETFALDAWKDGQWAEFAKGTSIGNRRLVRTRFVTTEKVRLRLSGPVSPAIAEVGLYAEPATAAK